MGGPVRKQRLALGGKPLYHWALEAFSRHPGVDQLILVVPESEQARYDLPQGVQAEIVTGGLTRTESVRNALCQCSEDEGALVLIHDGARPGLSQKTISDLIDALSDADAAVPVLPLSDALKRRAGEALQTVDRENVYRVQTPQAFPLPVIRKALEAEGVWVDDLAAAESFARKVAFVPGDERLSKVTFPGDLERVEQLLMPYPATPRVGTGFDVHAFGPGEHVTLCGVAIPHDHGLAGHSDADVAWHALTDAILGGAALGDIGDHFPPSDPQWKGADSALFLKHAVKLAAEAGWELASCDLTLICEAPKVKPHRDAMRKRTAEVTGLTLRAVSIKATTTEGLGFTGRGEGIAAQASAVLSPLPRAD